MHTARQQQIASHWNIRRQSCGWVLVILLGVLRGWQPGQAADFSCPAGDVACLKAAITMANTSGGTNTIHLEAGTYTLTP
jgi:hypothetical protein